MAVLLSVVALVVGIVSVLRLRRAKPLYTGWSCSTANSEVTLSSPDILQIAAVFLSIFLKYIPGTTGYQTRLVADSKGVGFSLQPVSLHGPISIVSKDIDTFNLAIISRQSNPSSTQQLNPFFLVSFTTPLLLFILSSHRCPIRPLGAVNTRNRFEFEDASFCRDREAILAAYQSGSLSYTCTFGGEELPGRRRKRGVEFDVVIEIKREKSIVFRQHLSFLQFLPSKHAPRFVEQAQADSGSSESTATSNKSEKTTFKLQMSSSHPRRWAASCSDYNPIHTSSLAAKAFGFRSAIAHGNHAIALAIQELINASTQREGGANQGMNLSSRFNLEVTFVKPMFLPADLSVCWQGSGKQRQLQIFAKETLVVDGKMTS